jgi:hypothetical protein
MHRQTLGLSLVNALLLKQKVVNHKEKDFGHNEAMRSNKLMLNR